MKKRTLNGRKSRNNLMIFAADKLTLTSAGRKAVFCSFASFSNSGLRYGLGNVEIQHPAMVLDLLGLVISINVDSKLLILYQFKSF